VGWVCRGERQVVVVGRGSGRSGLGRKVGSKGGFCVCGRSLLVVAGKKSLGE
jgi:hypothetical protein